MKIHIQNFQNVKEGELEIDGFTTVVGKSNIGKSSIVRAIEGTIHNKGGDDFVRDGHKYAEVHLETDDLDLVWRKGVNKNDYEINGDSYKKVGRGPPEVVREHGFGKIKTDRASINPQIAEQFSPIFLINPSKTSGSVAAEIISDIGRLSDVQNALKDASSDRRDNENTLKVRKGDLQDHKEDLKEYSDLDSTLERVEEVQSLREGIEELKEEIGSLKDIKNEKEELESKVESLSPVEDVDIPDPNFGSTISKIKELNDLLTSYKSLRDKYSSLQGVEEVEVPPPTEVEKKVDSLKNLLKVRSAYDDLTDSVSGLQEEIDEIDEKEVELSDRIDDLFEEAGKCPMCEEEV